MKKKISISVVLIAMLTLNLAAQDKKEPAGAKAPASKDQIVSITTDYGTMKVKLYNETPKHRDNFLKIAKEGFYNGTLFHRVIKDFMIQGGDPKSKTAGPDEMLGGGDIGYTIPAEFNPALIHKKGALCAARTENPEKASSGCQFYIVQGKKFSDAELNQFDAGRAVKYTAEQRKEYTTNGGFPPLDMLYTVYGEVISGMEVIDKIAAVQTKPGDRPVKDVKMTVKVVQ
ncbi:MAG TPA: peptidylprolyl isomerase [Bacteroidia bacterium]|nr:peptidylprolyl isomerase [Bacteroidia bacterium]